MQASTPSLQVHWKAQSRVGACSAGIRLCVAGNTGHCLSFLHLTKELKLALLNCFAVRLVLILRLPYVCTSAGGSHKKAPTTQNTKKHTGTSAQEEKASFAKGAEHAHVTHPHLRAQLNGGKHSVWSQGPQPICDSSEFMNASPGPLASHIHISDGCLPHSESSTL